jgi:hypothetical protein
MKTLIAVLVFVPGLAFAQSLPQPVSADPVAKADRVWQQFISQRQAADAQVMVNMARQIEDLTAQVSALKAELAAKATPPATVEAPK